MDLNVFTAISPIDGRYRNKVEILGNYFSESALMRYRVRIEIAYFIALTQIPLAELNGFPHTHIPSLESLYNDFSIEDAEKIKALEQINNHDIKSVEYFIKAHFETLGLASFQEFVHFGLTSQDINNTAIPLLLKNAMADVYMPAIVAIQEKLTRLASKWENIPMLAFTHGQPASPTRLGKEIRVFIYRLDKELDKLRSLPYPAKFGGATGNFNAHYVAYPHIDWHSFANRLVNDTLGLQRSIYTTQIENYDGLSAIFDNIKRIHTILIDLSRDIWQYIAMGYFVQKIDAAEVGSSAMPHKVNPIDFENTEGNLGMANAIYAHLSAKLPISRLQRDLTDSTVLRNVGVPFAHGLVALKSLGKGLDKLKINADRIAKDLEDNWSVVTEAIQTILRRESYPEPYEALKTFARARKKIDKKAITEFISQLDVGEHVKQELYKISPSNYTGK